MKITKELQETLINHPEHKTVYFDAAGNHYFNVFNLIKGKKEGINEKMDETKAKYGKGIYSHRQIIPGAGNVDGLTEDVAKGDPATLIVDEMSAEDVLNFEIKDESDKGILSIIANASAEEREAVKALLGIKEEKSATPSTVPAAPTVPAAAPKK